MLTDVLQMPAMFEIDEQNLPFVRTRQAFLLLDLQNDFISTGCALPVENPPNFIDNILKVTPEFRNIGNVIWIRSIFEASRPVNGSGAGSEKVITDEQLSPKHRAALHGSRAKRGPSRSLLERYEKIAEANGRAADPEAIAADGAEGDSVEETFLTIPLGGTASVVLPQSPGSNLSQAAVTGYDPDRDTFLQKSHYSAFKDGGLVQILRARFVTELYICGALTNISVFATAMDAAQYGYAITIVEDCLGYRSKARHDEALRQLTEFTGCDRISSEDLIYQLKQKAKAQQKPQRPPPWPTDMRNKDSGIDSLMEKLNLKTDASSAPMAEVASTGSAPKVGAAEHPRSSESVVSTESPELNLPTKSSEVEAKKRERVLSKIKTRRRPSKSVSKEPAAEKAPVSPTSATLAAASQKLEKLPTPVTEETGSEVTTTQEVSSQDTESVISTTKSETAHSNTTDGMAPKDGKEVESSSDHVDKITKAQTEDGPTPICEGDTTIINGLLDDDASEGIFEKVRDEVRWQKMSHQGGDVPRLIAVQGQVAEDGSVPIYRHPADESPPLLPFSPTVSLIQAQVEKKLGHAVNHVLIQFYRDGKDYISEHSDKTLDIAPKTFIANVSLGAQRTMVFRTKKQPKSNGDSDATESAQPRQACRAPLPHNSMCKMGLVTNMRWLHGIRQDKRMTSEKTEAELAFNGGRISLTFRLIGTFLDKDQQKIWGQGAVAKSKKDARMVINGDTPEAEKMIRAFGQENHSSEFDWKESYGEGFDVLHMENDPKLYISGDSVADLRAKILLAEYGVTWTEGKLSPSFNWKDGSSGNEATPVPEKLPVKFVDNDLSKSTVTGDLAIILYLDSVYGSKSENGPKSQLDLAQQFTRLQQSGDLLNKWRAEPFSVKPFRREMELWEAYASEGDFIAGSNISVADYAIWPILNEIYGESGEVEGLENLGAYYRRLKERECVVKALGGSGPSGEPEQKAA